MAELTKEWLQQTIAELEEERDATPGAVNEDAVMAIEAMKRALASLEAEPVYQVFSFKRWRDVSEEVFEAEKKDGCQVRVLYTAPPAPVSVPEWTNEQCLEFLSIAFRHAEIKGDLELDDIRLGVKMANGSRAAMLQGSEPVTTACKLRDAVEVIRNSGIAIDAEKILAERDALNSPAIPDGWVACSERMPEVRKPVYIFHPDYGVDQCVWYDHQEGAFVWGDETRLRELESVSHWMEMPKLPSTPRKEV